VPVYRLAADNTAFPDPCLAEPDGLLAAGGDLSPLRLLDAYRRGIFPWHSVRNVPLWWTPDPRCILLPEEFRVPRSLKRALRGEPFTFSFDMAFAEVVRACAGPRREQEDTWLSPEMIAAYERMHELGLAHSVEARRDGRLVGGLYGLALGGVFFGESMFHRETDASKAAFVFLMGELAKNAFSLVDCQQTTPHVLRFGAKEVPRAEFATLLAAGLERPARRGSWAQGIGRSAADDAQCVVLIGGRCSGKSTVGAVLARILDLPLHDTDRMIEEDTGSDAAGIVREEGWPGFRRRESRALARAVEAGGVVAGGGGIVLAQENRALMRASGLVFYLAAPAQCLYERMLADNNVSARPSLTGADPAKETAAVMAERETLYRECADYILDAAQPPTQTARAAARLLHRVRIGNFR
jgi:leucyl/phenylalanyl-tRNA--protein transferase